MTYGSATWQSAAEVGNTFKATESKLSQIDTTKPTDRGRRVQDDPGESSDGGKEVTPSDRLQAKARFVQWARANPASSPPSAKRLGDN